MILSETQERFVKAIAAQVPLEQIAEIHFFQPIRQGGVESGVAVIATRPEFPSSHPELPPGHLTASLDASVADSVNADTETVIDDSAAAESGGVVEIPQSELDLPVNVHSGELPPPVNVAESSDTLPPEIEVPPPAPANERHVIYTARYRLTLKGPDRGKWETNVVAEADAPLLTVDAVVRGVQRRSGDVEDPIRLTGEELVAVTRRTQHPAA